MDEFLETYDKLKNTLPKRFQSTQDVQHAKLVKVYFLPITKMPVYKDLPRLLRGCKIIGPDGQVIFQDTGLEIRQLIQQFITHLAINLGEDAYMIQDILQLFDKSFISTSEVQSCLTCWLKETQAYSQSKLFQLLKIINQEALSTSVLDLRKSIYQEFPYRDKIGTWRIEVSIQNDSVTLIHRKSEQSHSDSENDDFHFDWLFYVRFSSHFTKLCSNYHITKWWINPDMSPPRREKLSELFKNHMDDQSYFNYLVSKYCTPDSLVTSLSHIPIRILRRLPNAINVPLFSLSGSNLVPIPINSPLIEQECAKLSNQSSSINEMDIFLRITQLLEILPFTEAERYNFSKLLNLVAKSDLKPSRKFALLINKIFNANNHLVRLLKLLDLCIQEDVFKNFKGILGSFTPTLVDDICYLKADVSIVEEKIAQEEYSNTTKKRERMIEKDQNQEIQSFSSQSNFKKTEKNITYALSKKKNGFIDNILSHQTKIKQQKGAVANVSVEGKAHVAEPGLRDSNEDLSRAKNSIVTDHNISDKLPDSIIDLSNESNHNNQQTPLVTEPDSRPKIRKKMHEAKALSDNIMLDPSATPHPNMSLSARLDQITINDQNLMASDHATMEQEDFNTPYLDAVCRINDHGSHDQLDLLPMVDDSSQPTTPLISPTLHHEVHPESNARLEPSNSYPKRSNSSSITSFRLVVHHRSSDLLRNVFYWDWIVTFSPSFEFVSSTFVLINYVLNEGSLTNEQITVLASILNSNQLGPSHQIYLNQMITESNVSTMIELIPNTLNIQVYNQSDQLVSSSETKKDLHHLFVAVANHLKESDNPAVSNLSLQLKKQLQSNPSTKVKPVLSTSRFSLMEHVKANSTDDPAPSFSTPIHQVELLQAQLPILPPPITASDAKNTFSFPSSFSCPETNLSENPPSASATLFRCLSKSLSDVYSSQLKHICNYPGTSNTSSHPSNQPTPLNDQLIQWETSTILVKVQIKGTHLLVTHFVRDCLNILQTSSMPLLKIHSKLFFTKTSSLSSCTKKPCFEIIWKLDLFISLMEPRFITKHRVEILQYKSEQSHAHSLRQSLLPYTPYHLIYEKLWSSSPPLTLGQDLIQCSQMLTVIDATNGDIYYLPPASSQALTKVERACIMLRYLFTLVESNQRQQLLWLSLKHMLNSKSNLSSALDTFFGEKNALMYIDHEKSPIYKLILLLSQQMSNPAVLNLRNAFYSKLPYKSVKGSWRIILEVTLSTPSLPNIVQNKSASISHLDSTTAAFRRTSSLKDIFKQSISSVPCSTRLAPNSISQNLKPKTFISSSQHSHSLDFCDTKNVPHAAHSSFISDNSLFNDLNNAQAPQHLLKMAVSHIREEQFLESDRFDNFFTFEWKLTLAYSLQPVHPICFYELEETPLNVTLKVNRCQFHQGTNLKTRMIVFDAFSSFVQDVPQTFSNSIVALSATQILELIQDGVKASQEAGSSVIMARHPELGNIPVLKLIEQLGNAFSRLQTPHIVLNIFD